MVKYNPDEWNFPKNTKACYYAVHKNTHEKVLIPMCWGTVHSFDLDDCYCDTKKEPTKAELKNTIQILKERIEELEENKTV
ncbi:hypothetical protein [Flavobacterium sp. JP2137]|uniref:hypothetical protein n=1 Tax=Flavobacterium sp. JP2137 TaxID=3414510 RepID=UPI003D3010E3